MIDKLIQQLQDTDSAVRRRAIVALGRTKDAAALTALATVVRGDPDPELRDLARKAGQYIRRQMQQQTRPSAGDAPPAESTVPTAPLNPASAPRYKTLNDDIPSPPAESTAPTAPLKSASAPRYKALTDDIPSAPVDDDLLPAPEDHSPFMRPASRPMYEPYGNNDDDEPEPSVDEDDIPEPSLSDSPALFMRPSASSAVDLRRQAEDDLPDPSFGEEPSLDGLTALPGKESKPAEPRVVIVRGRKYDIPRQDRIRAKEYLDGALTLNMNGNNAKAMKDLTEALSLDPNLINDPFFNNIAATVTGLDGDAAAQMIIDRKERKRFTEAATRSQEARRIEQHMVKAQQSSWSDVYFEVGLYALIVLIGPILAVLVMSESIRNLMANFAEVSSDLPTQLQNSQAAFSALSFGALLPIGIVSGISGVFSLLFQTALIHYSARMLGGVGTWRHLIQVLLGFYNKWFPILFFVLYITITVSFLMLFSPVVLCFVLVLVGLSLYISVKTSSKVGEAYDFGAAKGCLTVIISIVVIGLINAGIGYLMAQTLSLAFNQLIG